MTGRRAELQGCCYKNSRRPWYLKLAEDGKVLWREGGRETSDKIKIEYGDFKPAEEVVREASGLENYNLKLLLPDENNEYGENILDYGIVSEDGERLYFLDRNKTDVLLYPRITEEEAAKLGWCRVKSQPQLT